MKTETDWDRFKVEAISLPTYLKRNLIHRDLLRAVRARAPRSVLEIGVGSGAQSAALSRTVPFTLTIDNDLRILRAAQENLRRYGPRTRVVVADAFVLPFEPQSFDSAISQGLMEHFSDVEVRSLISEQLRVCRSVVFSVPSDRYPRRDVGNERLLPPQAWQEIVEAGVDSSRYRVEARYYAADLEALKYSVLAGRWLGSFSVLVTIDPRVSD